MPSEDERLRQELLAIQAKSNAVADESLESTRRMLQMVHETQETGANTVVALSEQGEQLNRIEGKLDDMDKNLNEAEKNIHTMQKFCGLCICCWKITNDAREDEMDQNLAVVSDVIGNLKNMALDMGDMLDAQNKQLDRIGIKTDANNARVTAADQQTRDLINR